MLIGQRRDGGAPHHDHVVADAGQIAPLSGAKTLTQANQNEQRTDSPRYAEHGEESAQLVRWWNRRGNNGLADPVPDEEMYAEKQRPVP